MWQSEKASASEKSEASEKSDTKEDSSEESKEDEPAPAATEKKKKRKKKVRGNAVYLCACVETSNAAERQMSDGVAIKKTIGGCSVANFFFYKKIC